MTLADRLESSSWQRGCPVATVALETVNRSAPVQAAAAAAFVTWVDVVAVRLVELGSSRDEVHEVATVAVSILEGAELIARVQGSREPLEIAARRLPLLLGARS